VHLGREESRSREKTTDLIKSEWKGKGEKKKIVIERKENEWKKSRRPKLEKWKYRGKKRKGTDRQLKM